MVPYNYMILALVYRVTYILHGKQNWGSYHMKKSYCLTLRKLIHFIQTNNHTQSLKLEDLSRDFSYRLCTHGLYTEKEG